MFVARVSPLVGRAKSIHCSTAQLLKIFRGSAATCRSQPERPSPPASCSDGVYLLSQKRPAVVDLPEALQALRAYSLSERPETVELSVRVDMSLKKGKFRDAFRDSLIYPHSFGTQRKLLCFVEDSQKSVAVEAGADFAGSDDMIAMVEEGSVDFDVCICTAEMYSKISHLGKKLRAKMPNPRRGTVISEDVREAVVRFKQSRQFKSDRHGYICMPVGKLDFPDSHIDDNVKMLIDAVSTHRAHLQKAKFIQRGVLSSTYGPGFHINLKAYL